jgi:hypothetical protein
MSKSLSVPGPNRSIRGAHLRLAHRLHQVWSDLPDDKPRRALDPLAFGPALLPHLNLLRATEDDLRYELIGQELAEVAPRLRPGATASGILMIDPSRRFVFERLRASVETARPIGFHNEFVRHDGIPAALLAFVYPLDIEGSTAGSLLGGVWILERRARRDLGASSYQTIEDVEEYLFGDRPTISDC